MIYPYFGVKKIEEPLTHRGSLAFGLASAIHHLGSTCQFFRCNFLWSCCGVMDSRTHDSLCWQ